MLRSVTVLAGAAGSILLMLRVGHSQQSMLLMLLFTVWVLSPFAGLIVSKASALLCMILALTSLVIYGFVAFGPGMAKPAAPFLMLPLASGVTIAVAFLMRRGKRQNE